MIKTIHVFLFLIFLGLSSRAQVRTGTDALALQIPQASTYSSAELAKYIQQNFSSDSARARAIYVWITNNISYDFARLQTRNTSNEASRQAVADVLKTRKAVCHGYVDLFIELCTGVGIKTQFIGGYTKKDGVVMQIPHAWLAAELDGTWHLFDPTWGAGYIKDDQFVQNPNYRFYKTAPDNMIKDHMPFDPMYQFLSKPLTHKEFIEGKTETTKTKPLFNFSDTLKHYALLSPEEKIKSEARRMEASGIRNDLLQDRLNYLKKSMEPFAFNDANTALRRGIDLFNQYIHHKNQQFANLEDKDLQQLMDSTLAYTNSARTLLQTITPRLEAQKQAVSTAFQQLEKFQTRLLKEKEFVASYIAANKASRRQLFGRKQ